MLTKFKLHSSTMDSTNNNMENGHIVLSLMSQFCDSRLKEMSNKCSAEKVPKIQHSSIYSDVLASSSASLSGESQDGSGGDAGNSCVFVGGLTDPETQNQQLYVKRKINFSRHIKPLSIKEWVSSESEPPKEHNDKFRQNGDVLGDDNYNLFQNKLNESGERKTFTDIKALVKERLESYLPILKERVNNGKWAKLKVIPSLQSLLLSSSIDDLNKVQEHEGTREKDDHDGERATSCGCKWDLDQGLLFPSTIEQFVCYGMLEKPHSIKTQRLKRLFDCIGVASIPLQSMMSANQRQLNLVDATARIKLHDLSGKLKFSQLVSGVIMAIIGRLSGICLQVEDVIFATPCAPEWPVPMQDNIEMVFVSGLNLGNENGSNLALDLLQDYLLGLSGSAYEQKEIFTPRIRLFLVGNWISKSMRMKQKGSTLEKITEDYAKTMWKLESFLEPLVRIIEVFLIPGDNDLTLTSTLPQPPIHPKVLPTTGSFSHLKRLTNPARIQVSVTNPKTDQAGDHSAMDPSSGESSQIPECSLLESSYAEFLKEDVHFIDVLFQSGRNIKETMDYCDISCPIEMGIQLLQWGHLHPTYCDTNLGLAQDLFRLKGSLPHIVAIGNLSEFKSVTWNNSKVIGIPAFYSSQTAVVLTKDFDVIPISFKLV